jgi:uncharacterized damage-inducible protein DinB
MSAPASAATRMLTPDALLAHWQGHRRLTRRVIEAFPEEQLFTFTIGGMRPFGKLAQEFLHMSVPMVRGMVSDQWDTTDAKHLTTREAILAAWDRDTKDIDALWPQIPAGRFEQKMLAFGQYEGIGYELLFYVIDNEIHHRGQGYVYLRALGIEPPPFYDRS